MSETVQNRRSQLLAIKLRALVAEHLGRPIDDVPEPVASGSAVVVDGAAWVLVDGDAGRALGGAIAWAIRHDASSLDLIAESRDRIARTAGRALRVPGRGLVSGRPIAAPGGRRTASRRTRRIARAPRRP